MDGTVLFSLVLVAWSRAVCDGNIVSDESSTPYVLKFENPIQEFDQWKKTFGHLYDNDWNEEYRFHIFQKNLAMIEQHNWKYYTKESSYYLGVNGFAAMTHDEFLKRTGLAAQSRRRSKLNSKDVFQCQEAGAPKSSAHNDIPEELDWSAKGYTTPVKDQGDCGSCWIFGAIGAMEGAYYKAHNKLVSFSEQQILDCCHDEGCGDCNEGGLQQAAYGYVKRTGGIDTEDSYPYKAMVEPQCHYNKSTAVGHIKECFQVTPSGDESALQGACAAQGPISVSIDASSEEFQLYKGGVFQNPECKTAVEDLDHAVLLVGYGVDEETKLPYWKIKNSWGKRSWGVEGYGLMLRNHDNMCGIASDGSYVVME